MDETGPENWTIEPLLTFPCNKGRKTMDQVSKT